MVVCSRTGQKFAGSGGTKELRAKWNFIFWACSEGGDYRKKKSQGSQPVVCLHW